MNRDESKRKFEKYMGDREPAVYWDCVPKTTFWFDYESNEIQTDIGVNINCENYSKIWDCIWDLHDAIAAFYEQQGLEIRDLQED